MAMQSILASLMQRPPNPAGVPPMAPPPNSLGVGAPPNMPGLPPGPTMTGMMPTGSTTNNSKQSADVAISALTDAKGYFPSMGPQIDAMIAQFQASQATPTPAAPVGVPGGPGAAMPDSSPLPDSVTKGAV